MLNAAGNDMGAGGGLAGMRYGGRNGLGLEHRMALPVGEGEQVEKHRVAEWDAIKQGEPGRETGLFADEPEGQHPEYQQERYANREQDDDMLEEVAHDLPPAGDKIAEIVALFEMNLEAKYARLERG